MNIVEVKKKKKKEYKLCGVKYLLVPECTFE